MATTINPSDQTITQHAVQIGGANNTLTSLGVAASSTLLQGSTGADPSFTGTPAVTSITFGSGTALNKYVQGTFTPGIAFGGSSTGVTYTVQTGEYVQIGNTVFYAVAIILSSKGSQTGSATITGFPVTSAGSTNPEISINYCNAMTITGNVAGQVVGGGTTMNLAQSTTGSVATLTNTAFSNTSQIIFNGFYFTS